MFRLARPNAFSRLAPKQLRTYSKELKKCWSCPNTEINDFVCSSCTRIQPFGTNNFFEVFASPVTFDVSESHLKSKFRNLQSVFHPDLFTQKSEQEQNLSAEQSAELNKAYQTLKDPLTRSQYLVPLNLTQLSLSGHDITEGEQLDDQSFLMDVMDIQEEIEDSTDPEEIKGMLDANTDRMNATISAISDAFRNNEFDKAHKETIKLKYWYKIRKLAENK